MCVVQDSILQQQKIKLLQTLRMNLSVVKPTKKLKFHHRYLLQMIKFMKIPTGAAVNMPNYNTIENMKMNIIINIFRRRLKHEKHAVIQTDTGFSVIFGFCFFKKIFMLVSLVFSITLTNVQCKTDNYSKLCELCYLNLRI